MIIMETKKYLTLLLIPLFVFQFTSCDIFESTTISSKKIKKANLKKKTGR